MTISIMLYNCIRYVINIKLAQLSNTVIHIKLIFILIKAECIKVNTIILTINKMNTHRENHLLM